MATIRPSDLPAAGSVADSDALVVDRGSAVEKATPAQIVDAAIPLASQAEAEAGTDNAKRVTPLRVKQGIDALGVSAAVLASTAAGDGVDRVAGAAKAIATRTAMKALTSAADKARPLHLTESGREGIFVWDSSNLSAKVTNDPQEGIYVPPNSDATGASGAWVRRHGGMILAAWFGAKGDYGSGNTDDTSALNAALAYTSTFLNGVERATLVLSAGARYLISGTLTAASCSIQGNGAAIYASTAITMLHIKGNNQVFTDIYLRFASIQSTSTAIGVKLSENAVGAQASKNTFINVQTRNAYHGWYTNGGASGGSIFGCTFINCRSLQSYDWGWYMNCQSGTTTLVFINCQAEVETATSLQGKGFYIQNSNEVCMYNCAADKIYDGSALDIGNSLSVILDTFAIESASLRTNNSKLVNFSGNADVKIGQLKIKVPTIDVGAGNTGYYCYFSSGTRAIVDNIAVTNQTLTSGSVTKLRTGATEVYSTWLSLDDVNVNGNYNLFSSSAIRGFATNAAGLPTAGTTRRTVWNRLPSIGEPAFWVDDGTAYRAAGPLLINETTANLTSATAGINTTNKFVGKPVYNTTTNIVCYATGTAATDPWKAYDGSATHTPV